MLDELRGGRLLGPFRGRGPLDRAALVGAPAETVYKTLVVLREPASGRPILVLVPVARQANLKTLAAARGDLLQATGIAPELASIWLERGALEALSGDRDAARAAWLRAIELDRDGVVGAAARLRLQKMEADAN